MRLRSLLFLAFASSRFLFTVEGKTLVEFSMDKEPLWGAVGTCEYAPTADEEPFFLRLTEANRFTLETKSGEFDGMSATFKLQGHKGDFVSWFGIVRHITRMGWPHYGRLLIQNTYSDPLTDCHTQTVSINGAGDFAAELSDLPDDIIPLVLVRVYGVVTHEIDGSPVISAEYVRIWHFFQFNFMDFGADHSNPEWRSRIKLPEDERIYHIGVSRTYYAERLGPTPEQWVEINQYHERQTELEFETQGREPFHPSSTYQPTESERDWMQPIPEKDFITVQSRPDEPAGSAFQLKGELKRIVSWFGIVREVTPNGIGKPGGKLLIENKYFNGTKSEKLQTVSIHGAGNFLAEVTDLSEELKPLLLVRVYGRVVREENGLPVVRARYLRGWHLAQYNFDDYGEDHSDPRWTMNRRLPNPLRQDKVSADYYINTLGANDEGTKEIRKLFDWIARYEKQRQERPNQSESTESATPSPSP